VVITAHKKDCHKVAWIYTLKDVPVYNVRMICYQIS
jgi:hypothetical protein